MIGFTLRHPGELNSTIEDMLEGKRSRNTFIGKVKRDAGTGNYRAVKQMASGRQEWERGAANQPTG